MAQADPGQKAAQPASPQPAKGSGGYRWAIVVLGAVVLVLGTFILYAVSVIEEHQQNSYRQTFRGLHLVGHDIADNLLTLSPILRNFLPEPDARAILATKTTGDLLPRRDELLARVKLLASYKKLLPAAKMTPAVTSEAASGQANIPTKAEVEFTDAWKDWLSKTDKLNDLRKTPGYRGLNVSPLAKKKDISANCPTQLVISKFRETIDIVDCSEPQTVDFEKLFNPPNNETPDQKKIRET